MQLIDIKEKIITELDNYAQLFFCRHRQRALSLVRAIQECSLIEDIKTLLIEQKLLLEGADSYSAIKGQAFYQNIVANKERRDFYKIIKNWADILRAQYPSPNLPNFPADLMEEIAKYLSYKEQLWFKSTCYFSYNQQKSFFKPNQLKDIFKIIAGYSSTYLFVSDAIFACGEMTTNPDKSQRPYRFKLIEDKILYNNDAIISMSMGTYIDEHAVLILTQNGLVFAKGSNKYGQLGLGHYDYQPIFTLIQKGVLDYFIVAIQTGANYNLLLTKQGQVLACGGNFSGQLGLRHTADVNQFTLVNLEYTIQAIAAGAFHTLLLTNDGQVLASGFNTFGQLGLKHNNNINTFTLVPLDYKIKAGAAGNNHTLLLTEEGYVLVCGKNNYGQLGLKHNNNINTFTLVPLDYKIKTISAGDCHSLLLTEMGQLLVCGLNSNGQLGLGDDKDVNLFTLVLLDFEIIAMAAGGHHTILLTKNNKVLVCGRNHQGQLGIDSIEDKNKFTELLAKNDASENIYNSL